MSDFVECGKHKGGGLAAAGLGRHHQVGTGQGCWNRRHLDGGRRGEAGTFNGGQQSGDEPQRIEGHDFPFG